MGISIKTASGIALGGIVGFYLVNKALNFAKQSITEIAEASKWRAYYKHGRDGKMIPPGYSEMAIPDDNNREYVHPNIAAEREKQEKAEERKKEREQNQKNTDMAPIADLIEKIAKGYFKSKGIDIDASKNENVCNTRYSDQWNDTASCEKEVDDAEEIKVDDSVEAINGVFEVEENEEPTTEE